MSYWFLIVDSCDRFCRRHMAQLRQDHELFVAQKIIIVVIGPEKPEAFKAYWRKHHLPYIGVPDPDHKILKLYGQEANIFMLGRMPAQVIVDMNGHVRFVHYGHSMTDIPPNPKILAKMGYVSKGCCAEKDLLEMNHLCPSPIHMFRVN